MPSHWGSEKGSILRAILVPPVFLVIRKRLSLVRYAVSAVQVLDDSSSPT
jgi:hypothetical protein